MQFALNNLMLCPDNDMFQHLNCFLFQVKSKKINVNFSLDYAAQTR